MVKIELICKNCGKVYIGRGKYFCSIVCRNKFYRGSKSFTWKGGKRLCCDCGSKVVNRKAIRCKKCSEKYRTGDKASSWKGGITKIYNTIRNCSKYNTWRKTIYANDNYTCVNCGAKNGHGKLVILNADHFPKKMSDIIKENDIDSYQKAIQCDELWDVNNGRALCIECHSKIDNFSINFVKIIKHKRYENSKS